MATYENFEKAVKQALRKALPDQPAQRAAFLVENEFIILNGHANNENPEKLVSDLLGDL